MIWLGPKKIETPDIISDINKYLGSEVSEGFDNLNNDIQKKVIELVERIEFIDHLLTFIEFIKANKSVKKVEIKNIEGKNIRIEHFELIINGKDLAGADFDMEALVLYLLNTCIDKIKGQPEPVSSFKWLSDKIAELSQFNKEYISDFILKAENTFQNEYGLSRRFKEAFTNDISDELRSMFIENLIVVRLRDSKIVEESYSAWNLKTDEAKIKRIASKLYEIRSSYTHSAIRTFLPSRQIETIPNLDGIHLLLKYNFTHPRVSLVHLFSKTIKELTIKMIDDSKEQI